MTASRVVVRDATLADAESALSVVRQSIEELCVADHHRDPATLEGWLSNKTPQHFASWLADPNSVLVVAELDGRVRGVGNLNRAGKLHLCYVQPGFERSGLGRALLSDLEERARRWGLSELTLESTANARTFYARNGYEAVEADACAVGLVRCYPFKKSL